jgi:hypothetical protein
MIHGLATILATIIKWLSVAPMPAVACEFALLPSLSDLCLY